ncbi:MAG: archease [Deltaproteobacteria bacterium]|nr:archease [Deltaproteobacteria bacterium]TLN05096.1 MAG: archease [bacterium]
MPYRYLEDIATADVAFEALGKSVEEVFFAAAEATTRVMIEDPGAIRARENISFNLENTELDMLLFDFLQEIIFLKDSRRLLLRVNSLHINVDSSPLTLTAEAAGETMIQGHHPLLTDVKAVTLHRFEIKRNESGWIATVILDI